MAKVCQEAIFPYPWKSLEKEMKKKGISRFPLVGYGSLINVTSAQATLEDQTLQRRRPVITFGVRRLFNYEMPIDTGRYGPQTKTRARAALNIQFTGKLDEAVNGILFEISLNEIPAIRAREVGYDLVPVACLEWNEPKKPAFLAYIFRCSDEPRRGKCLTNDRIEPHREYYRVCRKGAREVSEEFLHFWLATTYLADGVTPVAQWEITEFWEIRNGSDAMGPLDSNI